MCGYINTTYQGVSFRRANCSHRPLSLFYKAIPVVYTVEINEDTT